MPHPFLLPHRQIDDHPDEFTCDQKLWELPWADDFRLLHEDGPLSIAVCRLYIDGVDTGGKSRKKAKKVLVFFVVSFRRWVFDCFKTSHYGHVR